MERGATSEKGDLRAAGSCFPVRLASSHSMRFLAAARDEGRLAGGQPIRVEAREAERPAGSELVPEQGVDVPLVYSRPR